MQGNDEAALWQVLKKNSSVSALLLIESGAFACSVLRQWRFRLHCPIGLICENLEVADEVAEKMGIFQHRVLNSNMPPSELLEALMTYKDDLIFIQFLAGRYTDENVETIKSICMRGECQRNELSAPVIVLFEYVIPENYQDIFSMVIELEENDLDDLDRSMVEQMNEVLKQKIISCSQVLEYEIRRTGKETAVPYGKDSKFWIAVVKMMAFSFFDQSDDSFDKLILRLSDTLQRAYDLADSYDFFNQIPDLFREELDKGIPRICKFFPEKKASELSAQEGEFVFFDDEYYYFSNRIFTRICEPLRTICTVNQVKAALARANILCIQGQTRVYRTVKKRIGNTTLRVICLKRENLEGNSQEMSYLDLFRIRGGKYD